MNRKLSIAWIKWYDWFWTSNEEIKKILSNYDIHELDLEACLEGNQKARIDSYDDYSFMVFHFPKYNRIKKIYELNEFNIFLWKEFLITFRDFNWNNIDKIFNYYSDLKINTKKKDIKVTSWYILYEITQVMLEKMFKVLKNVRFDIKDIESQVFDWENNSSLVKDIMFKKRNIITLKNMFKPQVIVLRQLEMVINKIYAWEIEVYFEDLEDKLEQIVNEINVLQEHIESIEDAFKSMVDIKTNFIIRVLTLFSAFMLPLTLITSFYGMNVPLPHSENLNLIIISFFVSIFSMFSVYMYLKKSWKF